MQPNTPHYVLGVENSIMLGWHFYATSAISDSCLGIIHSAILGTNVTNQDHPCAKTFLRRLMSMWGQYFQEGRSGSGTSTHSSSTTLPTIASASDLNKAHIPDIGTQEGLFDIIMVGNVLEFSRAFTGKSRAHSRGQGARYRLLPVLKVDGLVRRASPHRIRLSPCQSVVHRPSVTNHFAHTSRSSQNPIQLEDSQRHHSASASWTTSRTSGRCFPLGSLSFCSPQPNFSAGAVPLQDLGPGCPTTQRHSARMHGSPRQPSPLCPLRAAPRYGCRWRDRGIGGWARFGCSFSRGKWQRHGCCGSGFGGGGGSRRP
jgi:hypothetical protein